ncbi:MAG TPA: hypothetical protein VES62_05960 [Thermoleophilaceae bacterium]|nr:hypothetical protein [Thermoleophilaceae bacterium]
MSRWIDTEVIRRHANAADVVPGWDELSFDRATGDLVDSSMITELRTDTFHHWLEIAAEASANAETARTIAIEPVRESRGILAGIHSAESRRKKSSTVHSSRRRACVAGQGHQVVGAREEPSWEAAQFHAENLRHGSTTAEIDHEAERLKRKGALLPVPERRGDVVR